MFDLTLSIGDGWWCHYGFYIFAALVSIHFMSSKIAVLSNYHINYYYRCSHVVIGAFVVLYILMQIFNNYYDAIVNFGLTKVFLDTYNRSPLIFGALIINPAYILFDNVKTFLKIFIYNYLNQQYVLKLSSKDSYYAHVISYAQELIEKEAAIKNTHHHQKTMKAERSGSNTNGFTAWYRREKLEMMEVQELPQYDYLADSHVDLQFTYVPKRYDEHSVRNKLSKGSKFPDYMLHDKVLKSSYRLAISQEHVDFLDKESGGSGNGTRAVPRTREIKLLDSDDPTILYRFHLEAIFEKSIRRSDNTLAIYSLSDEGFMGTGWKLIHRKSKRDKNSVILDEGILDDLLSDAKNFFDPKTKKNSYKDLGIPYRRGYLLFGPPGCGKTSFAEVLASHLSLNLCILNLSHGSLDDSKLAEMVREVPGQSIILLEDIDAVSVDTHDRREGSENLRGRDQSGQKVSFSGLLNAIDGVTAQEGSIFMMTTNHFEKLDEALVRPGRCDKQIEVRPASKYQLEHMFLRFFPHEIEKAKVFANLLPSGKITMANLQGFFMEYYSLQNGAEICLKNLRELQNNVKCDLPTITQKTSISMFAYLERLSLEKYTPLFERLGIFNSHQLANAVGLDEISLQDLKKLSFRLRYDKEALRLFKMMFSSDRSIVEALEKERSLVDIADVRVRFYKYFKTTTELITGEKPVCLRRQISAVSHSRGVSNEDPYGDDSSPSSGGYVLDFTKSMRNSKSDVFSKDGIIHPENVDQDELGVIIQKLEQSFAANTTISQYNLTKLLWNFPNRPNSCINLGVKPGNYFNSSTSLDGRPPSSFIYEELSPAEFLKRAGLCNLIPQFSKFSNIRELFNYLRKEFSNDEDDDLSDCDTNDENNGPGRGGPGRGGPGRGGPGRGGPGRGGPGRPARYTPGLIALSSVRASPASSEPPGLDVSKDDIQTFASNNDIILDSISEEDKNVLKEIVNLKRSKRSTPNGYLIDFSLYDIPRVVNEFVVFYSGCQNIQIHQNLESLAYSFALKCSDKRGTSKVSLLEIKKYLNQYKNAPLEAFLNAGSLLEMPLFPDTSKSESRSSSEVHVSATEQKAEVTTKTTTTTTTATEADDNSSLSSLWVYNWLKSIDYNLTKHTKHFKDQNLINLVDFQSCNEALSDGTLRDILNISTLGDRMKIIYWHSALLQNKFPDGFNHSCSAL